MKKVSIGDICEINPSKRIPVAPDALISFVPMESVSTNGKLDPSRMIEYGKTKNYSVFQNGDVLFAKITPCMENGKCAIAHDLLNGYGAGSTEFIVLRPDDKTIFSKYLYHFIHQELFRSNCRQNMTGSAGQKRVPIKYLSKYTIPVPPLAEQERIVAKIEELFSQLDAAVAELKNAKEKLTVYRQAVLKEAFGSYIQNLTPFHSVANCRLGKMLDKEKNNGDFMPYLRNENVRWFSFDLSDVKQMRFKKEEIETFSIKRNDLVMCEGGEPGRCAVWNEDQTICFQKALHRVRLKGERNPLFYMYLFYYYSVSGFLIPFFTGSGIKHLPQEKLVLVPVPDPRKDEQYNTVSYIEERLSLFSNLQKEIDKSIQLVNPLRQSILKHAFEGKL